MLGYIQQDQSTITASAATWLASEPCLASVFHKRLTLFLSRSVVSRNLHSSYWPAILRSNPTASAGQHKRVELLVWLTPIAKILLALAAILTSLGLYDSIVLRREPEPQSFHYAQDTSVLDFGTMPRLNFAINRRCGGYPFWACPGNKVNVSESEWTEDTPIFTAGCERMRPTPRVN
ncbi:hypothetical protein BHE90_016640 [Fusarium euwallaceae]|uniref:Uncharacterized protein n=1 Tax=Fusarium euwallaceae TaxID=1147111 RepID=A0A430KZT6_9HYPO|nr:hypothetical protein BHE90_016640 [Fusarium euwallaceae]